jgi:hypothetical protein
MQAVLSVGCFTAGSLLLLSSWNCAATRGAHEGCIWKLYDFPLSRWLIVMSLLEPLHFCGRALAALLLRAFEVLFANTQHISFLLLGLTAPTSCDPVGGVIVVLFILVFEICLIAFLQAEMQKEGQEPK